MRPVIRDAISLRSSEVNKDALALLRGPADLVQLFSEQWRTVAKSISSSPMQYRRARRSLADPRVEVGADFDRKTI